MSFIEEELEKKFIINFARKYFKAKHGLSKHKAKFISLCKA